MTDLMLEIDEDVILQSSEVERYGSKEVSLDEMVLTNKNIICVYNKSTGLFSKPEMVVERIPLSTIRVANGKVQAKIFDSDDYGLGLQIFLKNGQREHFVFYDEKKELQRWEKKVCSLIGEETPIQTPHVENCDTQSSSVFEESQYEQKENIKETKNDNTEKIVRFCSYCGTKLDVGARFCKNCGEAVLNSYTKSSAPEEKETEFEIDSIKENTCERQTVYEGKIYKCPHCGDIIDAYEAICESCGYEIRNRKTSNAIEEFVLKLEQIENERPGDDKKIFNMRQILENNQVISSTDERKISLINRFVVPNTKEDLYEFLILASSNINLKVYDGYNGDTSKTRKALSDAWLSKFEQVYQKAKLSFGTSDEFPKFEKIYTQKHNEISNTKKKNIYITIILISILLLFFASTIIFGVTMQNREEAKIAEENQRLETVLEEVYVAIDKEAYLTARTKASNLIFLDTFGTAASKTYAKSWTNKRIQILEIIDNAEYGNSAEINSEGIILGYETSDLVNENYAYVKQCLENRGFSNIKYEIIEDIEPSWLSSEEGKVEKIAFGEKIEFTSISRFSKDVEIIIYYHALIKSEDNKNETQETKKTKEMKTEKTEEEPVAKETIDQKVFINRGSIFTYGAGEFELYLAKAVSDKIIKIEKWEKNFSTSKAVKYACDVGTFKINEADNNFKWLDDRQTAFSFKLKDKNKWSLRKGKDVIFTPLITEDDTNKGTNYVKNKDVYSYTNDDWHMYRAMLLTEKLIKIECWYRSMSIGSFNYGYDVLIFNTDDNKKDFEWSDNEHTAFTMTIQDSENSDLKTPKYVTFEKE